jgi:hypothetical protein
MATGAAKFACGWYRDPFRRHEDRYFSDGHPTKLVRDGRRESFDPPPEAAPEAEAIPATPRGGRRSTWRDLLRADDAERGAAFDRRAPGEKALSAMVRYGAAR